MPYATGLLDTRFGEVFRKIVTTPDVPVLFLFNRCSSSKNKKRDDEGRQIAYRNMVKKRIEDVCRANSSRISNARSEASRDRNVNLMSTLDNESHYFSLLHRSLENEQFGYWDPTSAFSIAKTKELMSNEDLKINKECLSFRQFSPERVEFDRHFSIVLDRCRWSLERARELLRYSPESLVLFLNILNVKRL